MPDEIRPPERPSYYAVIPADIRYAELPPRAILMYGEITALCNCHGVCTARNIYFARLYGITTRTVSSLIGQLETAGYIRTEILRNGKNAVDERRIWVNAQFAVGANLSAEGGQTPIEENFHRDRKKLHDPIEENFQQNNTRVNNKAPIAPKDVLDRLEAYAGDDAELREALFGFAEMRKTKRKPIATDRTLTLLLQRLDKLSRGDRRIKVSILNESTEKCWTGLFTPKDGNAAPARVIETEEVPSLD